MHHVFFAMQPPRVSVCKMVAKRRHVQMAQHLKIVAVVTIFVSLK